MIIIFIIHIYMSKIALSAGMGVHEEAVTIIMNEFWRIIK